MLAVVATITARFKRHPDQFETGGHIREGREG